jgi:CRISP-associated protein Cas1
VATAPLSMPDLPARRSLPDYLPARMVNEFVYCPRLFFYDWVDAVFRESADTIEGSVQHQRVDREGTGLPKSGEVEAEEAVHSRSVTLSSGRLRVIAKLDLIEVEGGEATPVDYKHGRPREEKDGLALWSPDHVQLAVQGMILRDNGSCSSEGVVFYTSTRQRVRVAFTREMIAEAENAIAEAWRLAEYGSVPPPLIDSPKCAGCSLAPICLPDEVSTLQSGASSVQPEQEQLPLFPFAGSTSPRKPAARDVRRLVTPRHELRAVYLNTPGLRIGKSGEVLSAKDKDTVVQEIRIPEICQLNLMGNVQITTQAVHALCEAEIPICYFSMGGWFYGITTGLCTKNVFLRERHALLWRWT